MLNGKYDVTGRLLIIRAIIDSRCVVDQSPVNNVVTTASVPDAVHPPFPLKHAVLCDGRYSQPFTKTPFPVVTLSYATGTHSLFARCHIHYVA